MSVQLEQPQPALELPADTRAANDTPTLRGLSDLWSNRNLIWLMVQRDFLGRYRGSMMGFFWTVINPLGHMLLYIFVFSVILKVKFGTAGASGNFALCLTAGLLPWTSLSESLLRVTGCVLEQPNLVKRVVFPLEILPVSIVVSSTLSQVIGMALLMCAIPICGAGFHATMLLLPLIMASQFMFTVGLGWLLSSLGVYLQDLRHVMALTLATWMYATPIVYPETAFPERLRLVLWANPMAGMVMDYRRILLQGDLPNWPMYAVYTGVAITVMCVGYLFFMHTKKSFADVM